MRKYLLICILFWLMAPSLQAQQDFRIGIVVDPGVQWLRVLDEDASKGNRMSFTWGLKFDKMLGSYKYVFTTGLLHNLTGFKLRTFRNFSQPGGEIEQVAFDNTYKLQMLEVPLGIKLRTRQFGHINGFGQFGIVPNVAFIARKDYTTDFGDSDKNASAVDDLWRMNIGMMLSAGAEYEIDKGTSIFVSGYFYNGFNKLLRDVTLVGFDDTINRLMRLGVRCGVFF